MLADAQTLRLEEVFKIGGVPTYTFVEPEEYNRLKVTLRTPGRGVIIEGPSGIGKSTAVTRALSELESSGTAQLLSARAPGDVGYIEMLPTTEDFGTVVLDDFHVLGSDTRSQIADLLKRLADTETDRSKLIIVGINRAGDSLIEHAPDLANRLDVIRFEVEPHGKIQELITLGEEALNIEIGVKERIVEGAQGSFYLAQLLCHSLCTEAGITEASATPREVTLPYSTVKRSVMERQERRFGRAVMGVRARNPLSPERARELSAHPRMAEGRRDMGDLAARGDGSASTAKSVGQPGRREGLAGQAHGDGGRREDHPLRPGHEGPIGRGSAACVLSAEPRLGGFCA
jgi:hypothetical protein